MRGLRTYRLLCTGRADDICRQYPPSRRFDWIEVCTEGIAHEAARAGHHVTVLDGESQMDRLLWLNAARLVVVDALTLAGVA